MSYTQHLHIFEFKEVDEMKWSLYDKADMWMWLIGFYSNPCQILVDNKLYKPAVPELN